jgi:hypothetical protein
MRTPSRVVSSRATGPVLGRLVGEHPDFDPRAMLAERP